METLTQPPGSLYDFGPSADEYESWYSTPEGQEHDLFQQKDLVELLGDRLHHGRLLDVGCGNGHWSRFFRLLGYEVQGVDISESMLRVAKATVPECTFDLADACALPFQDASFDIVASMAVLEFIATPALAVREMIRCIKPGGSLIIGTLNRLASLNRERLSRGEEPYTSGHLFSPEAVWDLLSPWGKPRMIVSSGMGHSTSRRSMSISDRPIGSMNLLDGPFMIVEVRR
jgi:SAM-dependent methyltransferase